VKRREAEQIVVALRDSGFPAECSLAPDQDNGLPGGWTTSRCSLVLKSSRQAFGQSRSGEYLA
jgi:hypothetical protein